MEVLFLVDLLMSDQHLAIKLTNPISQYLYHSQYLISPTCRQSTS